jgi:hypothetical protein
LANAKIFGQKIQNKQNNKKTESFRSIDRLFFLVLLVSLLFVFLPLFLSQSLPRRVHPLVDAPCDVLSLSIFMCQSRALARFVIVVVPRFCPFRVRPTASKQHSDAPPIKYDHT